MQGDQASIIGGAINFVKELEQRLQFLGGQKEKEEKSDVPFSEFFSFPQYSTSAGGGCDNSTAMSEQKCEAQSGIADIEVTMVESHANLKIRSKKRPKQLLKIVSSLHGMRLTILHLNVTTTGEIVLYSLSVKVCVTFLFGVLFFSEVLNCGRNHSYNFNMILDIVRNYKQEGNNPKNVDVTIKITVMDCFLNLMIHVFVSIEKCI